MAELRLRRYVRALFAGAFAVFMVNKFALRPAFESRPLPEALGVLTYSVPNFCEAVMGLTVISGLLWWSQQRGLALFRGWRPRGILALATVLTGTYVLTQEVGMHRLGGNNVFDPNDVLASLLGLAMTAGLFLKYGVLEEKSVRYNGGRHG